MRHLAIMALSIFLFSTISWGQANVNEGLETVSIYVDAVNGSDSNSGTQSLPLKTIGAANTLAESNNHKSIGSKVILNPGTYREFVSMGTTSFDTSLPITFEAATSGTVIISGADIWTNWQVYGGNASLYTASWPYQWGLCGLDGPGAPFEEDIIRRREMIVVNGTPITQVLSLAQMVYPGMFFVDEANSLVYIWPPAGTDMNIASVEVATRPHLLSVYSKSNIVFRGLTFEYASSCRNDYAAQVFGAASNVVFDTDSFIWNDGHGLTFTTPVANVTVENTVANHNGQLGFSDYETKNMLWQNDQASYNNWRGAQGVYYHWASAGVYFFSEHGATINGFSTVFNQTNGIHWDTDDVNITAGSLTSSQNLISGAFIEKNQGPMSISGSTFCSNGAQQVNEAKNAGGVTWRNSQSVTLTSNTLYNNGGAQISIQGTPGGIAIHNWETGHAYNLVTQNLVSTQNMIVAGNATQTAFSDAYLGGADWITFQSTLTSNNNTWFGSAGLPFAVAVPIGGTLLDFSAWQNTTGQDLEGSTFAQPSAAGLNAACAVTPDFSDYWFLADNPAQTISVAGNAVFNVSTVPVGTFNENVNLSVDGASEVTGLSASLSQSLISGTGSSAVLTINAAPNAPAGTYPITVIANSATLTHTLVVSLTVPTTSLRLSAASLNFPGQQTNTISASQTVALTNVGTASIAISSITASNDYAATSTCGGALNAGTSCSITVSFAPRAVGSINGSVTLVDSDPSGPQILSLSGLGTPAPLANVSPSFLGFGSVYVGASTSKAITLTNAGSVPLNISSMAISGVNAAEFSQTNTCGASVAAGGGCVINAVLAPVSEGAKPASLTITDNGAGSGVQSVILSGTGVQSAASLSPAAISFGSQLVGARSSVQKITLSNTGNTALKISGISIAGANSADFSQTTTCGTQLGGGGSCSVKVTFTPAAIGWRSAQVIFADDAPSSPQSASLSGTGTQPTSMLSTTLLSFGNQLVSSSASQTVTLTNSGSATLSITSVKLTGTNTGDFLLAKTCANALSAGASCTVTVTFRPVSSGSRSASLSITDSAPDSPQIVALTGTGTAPMAGASPSSLSFGQQVVGVPSAAQIATLTNSGTGALTITSIKMSGANASDFTETDNCGTNLAASASCTINLVFKPAALNSPIVTMKINDDAVGGPQTVSLSGSGISGVKLSSNALAFGTLNVGQSATQSATMTNLSTTTLNITSTTIGGANAADFVESNTCGQSLAGGASCNISVTFSPKVKTARSASVSIKDTDVTAAQKITLTGSGN